MPTANRRMSWKTCWASITLTRPITICSFFPSTYKLGEKMQCSIKYTLACPFPCIQSCPWHNTTRNIRSNTTHALQIASIYKHSQFLPNSTFESKVQPTTSLPGKMACPVHILYRSNFLSHMAAITVCRLAQPAEAAGTRKEAYGQSDSYLRKVIHENRCGCVRSCVTSCQCFKKKYAHRLASRKHYGNKQQGSPCKHMYSVRRRKKKHLIDIPSTIAALN